jgi:hypothetical protein
MPPNQGRTKRFNMVMTPEEWAMAVKLAEKRGLTVSDILRLHVRETYEREFGQASAAPKARPKRAKK